VDATRASRLAGVIDLDRLLAFAVIALVIIAVPGPSVLFVVGRGVALGRRAALATVLGNEAGLSLQVVAVAFGLGTLVEQSVTVFTVLKFAGACYLVFLGVQAIRHRTALADALGVEVVGKRFRRIVAEGFVVGATNPKSLLLFTAVLPQFINPSSANTTGQLLLLGLVGIVIALLCDSSWAILAGTARAWLGRSRRRLEIMGGAGGLAMIGLGVQVAFTGRKD
jgi:threonine/homoserine/homoserine lactone efflux protein